MQNEKLMYVKEQSNRNYKWQRINNTREKRRKGERIRADYSDPEQIPGYFR